MRFSGKKVLLAENSLISAVHAESILKHWNLKIDVVRNGKEAVHKVKDSHYDIVLLTIQMPEMDGLETAKQIRLMGYNLKDLPILALTARTISMDVLSLNGINDIILKPFSVEDLESKFDLYLHNDF